MAPHELRRGDRAGRYDVEAASAACSGDTVAVGRRRETMSTVAPHERSRRTSRSMKVVVNDGYVRSRVRDHRAGRHGHSASTRRVAGGRSSAWWRRWFSDQ